MKTPHAYRWPRPGPFRVAHLRPGDPYELVGGHAIVSEPSGPRHGQGNLLGAALLDSDPAVEAAGVDVGFALDEQTLLAPDVAVSSLPNQSSFVTGVPALALEYVETHANETELGEKIDALLAAGTQVVWVVRLGGKRQVEVHRPGEPPTAFGQGDILEAPGILRNPVPIDALYDRQLAHEVVFRNLLQRKGYANLDVIRDEGHAEGRAEGRTEGMVLGGLTQARTGLRQVLAARDLSLTPAHDAWIDACTDTATLDRWLRAAVRATTADDVFVA